MNRNRIFTFFAFTVALFILASCGITSHPNEKIIVGTWRPVKVEKVVDSSALLAAQSASGGAVKPKSKPGGPAGEDNAGKREATLDRLVQSEMRATMEIFANKTAVKNFPGNPLQATWKMKGRGTRIVAKGVENKRKFVIDILDITKERIEVIEHTPVGDIKIIYERQF